MSGNKMHPFEKAGLGIAPFKFVRHFESKFQAIPGDPSCPIQPGSSCDYCANGIMQVYVIRGADGREFKVGSDCVEKVAREAATTDAEKMAAKVDDARRKHNRNLAHARADEKAAELAALLDDSTVQAKLAGLPHPNTYRAELGDTLLDWAQWMVKRSGAKGHAKTLATIKAVG